MSPAGRPPFVTVPWCSFAASHAALQGILSALFERERSGHGQWVEANLAQALTIHEGASSSWYGYLVSRRWPDAYVGAPSVDESGIAPMHHFVSGCSSARRRTVGGCSSRRIARTSSRRSCGRSTSSGC